MIKRMVIMLIAVGIVLGGFFAFQNFKAHIIQQVMATMANPPQTVATVTAGLQDWQPQVEAVGSLRAVNGADLSLEVVRHRRPDRLQLGRRCRRGHVIAAATIRGRCGETAGAAGHRGSRAGHLRPRCEAIEGAGDQPGDRGFGQFQSEERARAGRAAEGDAGQENAARAVRRSSRHPRGRCRTVSDCRHHRRDVAGAGSDLCRLLPAAAGVGPGQDRPGDRGQDRYLSRADIRRDDRGDQSAGGCQLAKRAGARHARQSGSQAAARHVCHDRHRYRRAAAAHHAAADSHRL